MYREFESNVRSYCRSLPAEFHQGYGSTIVGTNGKEYIDFLSGCGSLNYGHNHPELKHALLEYIEQNGVAMSLDMATASKRHFVHAFVENILKPRGLDYKLQFPGPTGTNAVEAAVKLARKFTGRTNIIAFTNGFHGCSLGALALTGNAQHREASAPLLTNVSRFPYDAYLGEGVNTAEILGKMLSDPSSGCDAPAAIIFEAIQGEGGLNVASPSWAQDVERIAQAHGALVIVDDIQAGCGRSGTFFSFETLGIVPDIVCLSKSLSGFGLPMSLVLLRPECDVWAPGEHNGTFRGNNHAFVTAATAIELFWKDNKLQSLCGSTSDELQGALRDVAEHYGLSVKGRGMMLGLDFGDGDQAGRIQAECFERSLIVERCGPRDEVLKLLPPLNVEASVCEAALTSIKGALAAQHKARSVKPAVLRHGTVMA